MLEITLEGPRGAGKTTFAEIIKTAAENMNMNVKIQDEREDGKTKVLIRTPQEAK